MKWRKFANEMLVLILVLALFFSNSIFSDIRANTKDTNFAIATTANMGASEYKPPVTRIWIVDDDGSADFSTIQDAVNEVNEGDMIIIRAGTYIENVKVNKDHLIIKSENGADATIVQAANEANFVFEVTADYVSIIGFTVKRSLFGEGGGPTGFGYAGIYLEGANYCNISKNSVSNNSNGIYLQGPSNENVISDNIVYDFYQYGICVKGVPSGEPWGVPDEESSIHNLVSGNDIHDGRLGICLILANKNTVVNNTAYNNDKGILIDSSHNNTIQNNVFSNNKDGIIMLIAGNNTLTTNNCINNVHGMVLKYTTNNVAYLNSIINNPDSISVSTAFIDYTLPYSKSFDSINIWNTQEELSFNYNNQTYTNYLGNYWSDYDPLDSEGIGGIGYTPYKINANNTDYYPLMNPWGVYKLIPTLSATDDIIPPSLSKPADIIYGRGTMEHLITWIVGDRHPGTYELYTNSILMDSGSWTNGTITWSASGLPPGTYNVTLVVWDTAENHVSDTVWVDIMALSVTVIPTTPSFYIPGLIGIPILAALVMLGLWRKRK